MQKDERKIRIGVLGCSDIARRRFLPALAGAMRARLAAVGTRNAEQARSLPAGGACSVLSYEELLADPDVDLVYISLPNDLHEEWTLRALAAGKHVLCEKPVGLTAASVDRMIASAASKGLFLGENIMYLHHPRHALVRDLAGSGAIGKIRTLRACFGFHLTKKNDFRLDAARGGGVLHDLARYPLSAALYHLAGRDYDFSGWTFLRGDLPVAVTAAAATSAQESFFCSIGFEQQYECRYELIGEEGSISVERAFTTPSDHPASLILKRGSQTTVVPVGCHDHFRLMIDWTASLILGSGDFQPLYGQMRRLALAVEQLRQSCRPVLLGDRERRT